MSSRYRGVSIHKRDGTIRVRLKRAGYSFELGACDEIQTEEDAARAYDVAAQYLHGPNAQLNFDGEPPAGLSRLRILGLLARAADRRGFPTTAFYWIP